MKKKIILPATLAVILMTSCVSREKIIYFQDIEQQEFTDIRFETTIKPDDLLMIIVSAHDPRAAAPYNLMTDLTVNPNNQSGSGQRQQQLYLVDQKGTIDFPVLGKVNVGGKTKDEIIDHLKTEISKDVKNPIINLRIMNFKVTVNGE